MDNRPNKNASVPSGDCALAHQDLIENVGQIGRWHICPSEPEVHLSRVARALLGLAPEPAALSFAEFVACFGEEDRSSITTALDALLTGEPLDLHTTVRRGDGDRRIFRLKAIVVPDEGIALGLVHDLTDLQNTMLALAVAHERHADFTDLTTEWMWEIDESFQYTYIATDLEPMLGMPAEESLGTSRKQRLVEIDGSLEVEMHLNWLDQQKPYHDFRYQIWGAEGDVKFLSSSGKPFYDNQGNFRGFRGIERDLTEFEKIREELTNANRRMNAANKEKSDAMASLKEAFVLLEEQNEKMVQVQEEIRHRAFHDPLTGVGNRRYLEEFLLSSAEQCQEEGRWLGLLHIDLDRFKEINDTFGHAAGDAVLNHVAKVLEDSVGESDFVARVGGDEFVVVSLGEGGEKVLSDLAQSLIDELGKPVIHEGQECWFGASIGIATMHGTEIKSTELMVNADVALYRAKNSGRGRYEFFSEDVQTEIRERKAIADGIRAGLARGEFVAFYQPQICAHTYRLVGCEALARWHHPRRGLLAPNVFMSIAEEINLLPAIDRSILDAAISDLNSWETEDLDVPKISVNLSARRLIDQELVNYLRHADLPRGKMAFELLESIFLDDVEDRVAWNIDTLKEMGFEIELDDFGSGHASLTSLASLAPDTIKIDRGLISTISTDPKRRSLVRAIIGIGKSMGVRITAEGVETADQAKVLAEYGCDTLQGYLFAKPLSAEDFASFVRTWPERLPGDQIARRA